MQLIIGGLAQIEACQRSGEVAMRTRRGGEQGRAPSPVLWTLLIIGLSAFVLSTFISSRTYEALHVEIGAAGLAVAVGAGSTLFIRRNQQGR
jgi:hypothetical protein